MNRRFAGLLVAGIAFIGGTGTTSEIPFVNHGCFEDEVFLSIITQHGNETLCVPADDGLAQYMAEISLKQEATYGHARTGVSA